MVKLFSVQEIVELEKKAHATGLSYPEMMENAGKGLAVIVDNAYSHFCNRNVFGLVGSGNNGGDALVALTYLAQWNWSTAAYIVGKREKGDPLIAVLLEKNGIVITAEDDLGYKKLDELINNSSILLDGVLGTGTKLPLKGDASRVLESVRTRLGTEHTKLHVVAVDCPSGVDCDSGDAAPETIPADITVTMAGYKQGLIKFPAAGLTGDIHVASIGDISDIDEYKVNKKEILTVDLIKASLPRRPRDSHKGTFGTAFIIAGSINFTGAALLAGMASYRIGAGLVTMAVPEPLHAALSGHFPEATWVLLPHELGVIAGSSAQVVFENIDRATALLIGPGFGLEEATKQFLERLLHSGGDKKKGKIGFLGEEGSQNKPSLLVIPCVIDADGLKLISKIENWHIYLPKHSVLTPHPGEMSILTGLSVDEIQKNRIEMASKYASTWGHIVVLKGAFTVIAEPGGRISIVPVATPALAKAGTGDVLAGLITGLLAQGVEPYNAACTGAWIHAHAGLLAEKTLGNTASVVATDVLNAVPSVLSDLLN